MKRDWRTSQSEENSQTTACTRARKGRGATRLRRKQFGLCKQPSTQSAQASESTTNDNVATRLIETAIYTATKTEYKGHRNVLHSGYQLNQYTIDRVIGRGGFGITYLAYDQTTQSPVAIKEFLPSNIAVRDDDACVRPLSDEYVDTYQQGLVRFIDEAGTLVRFNHPNIVRLNEVFLANNTAYMVMEYLEGETLSEAFKTGRVSSESQLTCILNAMMHALKAVHAKDLLHRDIKPSNIFITRQGRPVLIDFGSARHAYGAQTQTLTALVSPGYAPFEQYHMTNDLERQGPWTDMYALACTLYRGIAGRCYDDAVVIAHDKLAGKHIEKKPATIAGKGRFSREFLRGIDEAMRFCGKDRPQTIGKWRRLFTKIDQCDPLLGEWIGSADNAHTNAN